jgi:hypothetical protein
MELSVPDSSLLVFVDDTGHEDLVPGHTVYGLGGCAILAADPERIIRHPWHEVRRRVRGSADTPLHASALGHPPRMEDVEVVAKFFRSQPFARIGAIISNQSKRDDGICIVTVIAETLKRRIVNIARWTPFSELHVIFEASGRADELIEQAFGDFRLEENGRSIPVGCYFMPKSVHDPALEVADFVVHAVGRQARRRIEGREGFAPDFAAVFHNQDPKRVSYIDVAEVKRTPAEQGQSK